MKWFDILLNTHHLMSSLATVATLASLVLTVLTIRLTVLTIRKTLLESRELKRKQNLALNTPASDESRRGTAERSTEQGPSRFAIPWSDPDLFIGREREIAEIVQVLEHRVTHVIVSISGLGGIGKTALAREVARRSFPKRPVIWATAKEREFVGATIRETGAAQFTPSSVLDMVYQYFDHQDDTGNETLDKKKLRVRKLLHDSPALIVLDNLDTCESPADLLATLQYICQSESKAIVTSRVRLDDFDSVHTTHLAGLDQDQSNIFLRRESAARNVSLAQESDTVLRDVWNVTGGAPLAMKLVVGLSARLPLESVLTGLRNAQGDIYRFIYFDSWRLLSVNAQKVLVAVAAFASPASTEALSAVNELSEGAFPEALNELSLLSLVEVHDEPTVSNRRYGIHPLTRHFVTSDLKELWNRQKRP